MKENKPEGPLEIIYRIYQVGRSKEDKDDNYYGMDSWSKRYNTILALDCMIVDSREQFKNSIRDIYGKNIKFRYSKDLQEGELYCIIIGEHCYNGEKYFNQVEYECAYCHSKVKGFVNTENKLSDFTIRQDLMGQFEKYGDKKFCCYTCEKRYLERERTLLGEQTDGENIWVDKDMFTARNIAGYIYKITKKSTGEFYIGQTIYVPTFRWAQHLTTERFHYRDILDYQFETIEIVPITENLLEREKYWIQKCYKENPSLSLNIMQTQQLRKEKEGED